jgi:hypothetical protein
VNRSKAVVVRDVGLRTGFDQRIRDRQIVDMSRPVERGRPVALAAVHVGALPDCRPHGRHVLAADGLDQPLVRASACRQRRH